MSDKMPKMQPNKLSEQTSGSCPARTAKSTPEHIDAPKQETTVRNLLHACTKAVLPFSLGDDSPVSFPLHEKKEQEKHLAQALRAAKRTGKSHFILLGAGDGNLPDQLADTLPDNITLTVIECIPAVVRHAMQQGKLGWWQQDNRHRLLTDTSPWALVTLLWQTGLMAQDTTMFFHPALPAQHRDRLKQWQRVYAASSLLPPAAPDASSASAPKPRITVAAILHPEEPHLDDFIEHIPPHIRDIKEILLIWDAEEVPATAQGHRHIPTRHLARPLKNDFAAQRNKAIDNCRTDWMLMLDGDERFSPEAWELLPDLLPPKDRAETTGAFGFCRMTFLQTTDTCRTGFGLWPDIQIRLFRIGNHTMFERPIHERLTGVDGATAICLTAPIQHYSHLFKTDDQLKQKLAGFNEAAGSPVHSLSAEYPSLESTIFTKLASLCLAGTCVKI